MAGAPEGSLLNNSTARRLIANFAHKIRPFMRTPTSSIAALSLATATAVVLSLCFWRRPIKSSQQIMAGAAQAQNLNATFDNYDPKTTDPDLLRNNSEIKSFTTSRFTYPAVRIFYKPHPRLDELPNDPAPLPLLVFVHGLGGSVVQFQPLLSSLTHNSSCLAIDLPGCGLSELSPTAWDAYTNEALTELLDVVIATYRNKQAGQGVVLIGHSMGCSLSARLASPDASKIADHVMALIAICPPAGPPTAEQVNTFRKLLWIPTPVFDLWRSWDARGGVDSASIKRFVGADADLESRRLQKRFNRQSRTPTWRRMAWGSLPTYEDGVAKGGIAGQDIWATLDIPVFLISGGKDHITPAKEIERIAAFLKADVSIPQELTLGYHQPIVDVAAPIDTSVNMGKPAGSITEITEQDFQREKNQLADSSEDDALEDPTTPHEVSAVGVPPQPQRPAKVVKTIVIPHGTHALIYTQDCSHVLASIIADFLSQHITGRLSRSWQLQYLNKEGKWELKNLTKWQGVVPVSKSVAGVFRAMKTMREVDEEHSPVRFVEKWGNIVKDVVDISKDIPIYDPAGLQRAGVRYHKFPTVSKIPPTDAEVDKFIALVDRLRKEQATRAEQEHWDPDSEHAVGVHCHYGYNRTGYFIVCYLIERCGHGVQQAIDAFASARPKGIRHSHFKDQLFVRYSGLGRRTAAVSSSSAS